MTPEDGGSEWALHGSRRPPRNRLKAAILYRSNRERYMRATGQRVRAIELIRFFEPWYRSLAPGRSPIGDRVPWIVFSALEFLDGRVAPGMRVLEFGVGGSTLYFLRRGCLLTSIEHDEKWEQEVARHLTSAVRRSWTPIHVPPDATPVPEFLSQQPEFEGLTFQAYAQAADRFPDGSFDIVLVDGRARSACIERALPKVRPEGGVLMLDNAERPRYAAARELADRASSRRLVFGGPGPFKPKAFWQTLVWEM